MDLSKIRRYVVGLALLIPAISFAQSDALDEAATTAGLENGDLTSIIGSIINVALTALGVVFLLLVIYAGFTWMTAGGDDKKVTKAKNILVNATIGLVLTLSAYGIASFVINALTDATNGGRGSGNGGSVSIERLSGSLGSGAIRDHYPDRNATDVARNTRIFVTFAEEMSPASFIQNYDADSSSSTLNTENVLIYATEEGEEAALSEVSVTLTEDMKTVVFDPEQYLGSSTADTSYTVFLNDNIENADGETVLNAGGYEWSFEVGTTIDLDPPTVTSVTPIANSTPDRNITVQITFDEAIDPTSSTGTYSATEGGFTNIQMVGTSSTSPVAGTYAVSNSYRTITFTSADACGTNSCDETIYCLPGGELISATALSASAETDPPQADLVADYDGIVDMAGNALDGVGDGTLSDYSWSFTTTNDINLDGPVIETINPNVSEGEVALDQDVEIVFDSIMMGSTISSDNIALTNEEATSGQSHEQWYAFDTTSLTSADEVVSSTTQSPAKTRVTVSHGTFLESTNGYLYQYGVTVGDGVRNEYQNCYVPANGPDSSGGECGVTDEAPYCCNGVASSTACSLF